MLAKPFGAVVSLVLGLLAWFHPRSKFESDWVGITGPAPTVPQDDEVPCWAKAVAGQEREAPQRSRSLTRFSTSIFPFFNSRYAFIADSCFLNLHHLTRRTGTPAHTAPVRSLTDCDWAARRRSPHDGESTPRQLSPASCSRWRGSTNAGKASATASALWDRSPPCHRTMNCR